MQSPSSRWLSLFARAHLFGVSFEWGIGLGSVQKWVSQGLSDTTGRERIENIHHGFFFLFISFVLVLGKWGHMSGL